MELRNCSKQIFELNLSCFGQVLSYEPGTGTALLMKAGKVGMYFYSILSPFMICLLGTALSSLAQLFCNFDADDTNELLNFSLSWQASETCLINYTEILTLAVHFFYRIWLTSPISPKLRFLLVFGGFCQNY